LEIENFSIGARSYFNSNDLFNDPIPDSQFSILTRPSTMNDLRFAFRQLLKNPGFTAVAVLTLALGMGANVSFFSLFNSAALRPLPGVKAPDEVVYASDPSRIVYPQYQFYRDHSKSFSGLVASGRGHLALGTSSPFKDDSVNSTVVVHVVAGDYFGVLGAEAPLGRYFLPDEYDAANGPLVVVLSHRFWQRYFDGNAKVVGQTIRLNGEAFTIVGVAPETFPGREPSFNYGELARNGIEDAPDVWSPLLSRSQQLYFNREAYDFRLIGRLKNGVTSPQAETELKVLAAQLIELSGEKKKELAEVPVVRLVAGFSRIPPLRDQDEWAAVAQITALLTLVLLVACANIANLLLAKAADRQKEVGVRQALGASRGRLVRQFLTESVLLALMGGMSALLASHWTMALAKGFAADAFPEYRNYIESLEFALDFRVVAYVVGLSLASGILFGLAPALHLLNSNFTPALKEAASAMGTRVSRSSFRNALVIGQVAVSLAFTIGAGLLVRSVQVATTREFTFATRDVLIVQLTLPGYDLPRTRGFHREVLERLSALPGVESVGLTSLPEGGEPAKTIMVDDGRPQPLDIGFAGVNRFSPGYLETLQIPLLHGRNFSEADIANDTSVALVSESMARRYWPNENAVGKHFSLGPRSAVLEVIGITRDAIPPNVRKTAPGGRVAFPYSAFAGVLYLPLQANSPHLPAANLVVRVAGKPTAMIASVINEVNAIDPRVEASPQVLREMMDAGLAPFIAGGMAASSLGLLASMLATMGIYGVMAYLVSRRTHEVGVRMALGARKTDVLQLIIGEGMRVVLVGLFVGIALAFILARLLASKLFGLSPLDPVAFGGVTLLLLGAALLACFIPARRATKVDPMVALRYE
jgi:putative ABC transport system permease protein